MLGCHSRSGRARSSTPVHGQTGRCLLWSLVCIEYETESEASEGQDELQPILRIKRAAELMTDWSLETELYYRHLPHREAAIAPPQTLF